MSLKVSINTLYYPNSDPDFVNAHKSVMKHFGVSVNYHETKLPHGYWMDTVMHNTNADVIGFLDIDCIPLTKDAINELIKFVVKNKSIAGNVQASNHIIPMTHTFVAPSCFFIWKGLYDALERPSFGPVMAHSDVAESLCYIAEENGVRMKALYPTHFEKEPEEGVWRLNNYGLYGVGTVFDNKFYHLFQSRFKSNVDMFIERSKQVVAGTFNTDGMFDCKDFDFTGRICKFNEESFMRRVLDTRLV